MASPAVIPKPVDYSISFKSFTFEFDVRNDFIAAHESWKSPIFTDHVTNYRWVAEIGAKSRYSGGYYYERLCLFLHDSPNRSDLYVKCQFHLIENGIRRNLSEFRDILPSTSNRLERSIDVFCQSNEVRMSVTVDVESSVVPEIIRSKSVIASPTCNNSFSTVPRIGKLPDDMLAVLNNGKYSDMRIEVADVSIPVHKVILATRSPVFAAMFEHDMLEKREGCVEIRDFDVQTVRHFVQFLYTGRTPNFTYELATELIRAADMYVVTDLKDLCEEYLSTKCTESNCLNLLVIADRYGASRLKKSAISFVCAHPDILKKSDQIVSLPNSLMGEIMLELATKLERPNVPLYGL